LLDDFHKGPAHEQPARRARVHAPAVPLLLVLL
jgi:hypothetical protein